jgi:ABC-2 type transport system ATP-binding protein
MSVQMATGANGHVEPMIRVEGLQKRYGQTRALDGLTMAVEPGSIYGFVGPNGAGKTTTMRILATLLQADGGSGQIAGEDVRLHPGRVRARLGFMPDFFGVYEDLSVYEYLDFYARSYGVPAKKRRTTIDELLELIDLPHKRNDMVENLSRGMKQRLGLARCLVHDPDVLLLDEPASGMDPRARYEMREIVKELQRLGKTVLISSHILLELAEMCTHIGIIQDGRLIREGPVDHVLRGMQPGRSIELRLLGGRQKAARLLAEMPDVTDITGDAEGDAPANAEDEAGDAPATLMFRTFADDHGLRDTLRALVAADVGVVSFAVQRDNLEDVFMQLTERNGD